ncbi:hypothetical protein CEK25_009103 [Fusarium fujikuroi]|nr:hypothetical protein CEK25_009103 [Fusarium fujikuroi]
MPNIGPVHQRSGNTSNRNLDSRIISSNDETGLWLVQGMIVQLACESFMDPNNFPSISLLQGEMRRRVWSHCYLRLSSQIPSIAPCVLKSQQYDTAVLVHLETRISMRIPLKYLLKTQTEGRIDKIMGLNDLVNDTRPKLHLDRTATTS